MTGGTTTTSHAKYALYWKSSQKGDFVFSTLVVSNSSTYLRCPKKLSSCCHRFFKWVAKRHHQVFDSPLWCRCFVMMNYLGFRKASLPFVDFAGAECAAGSVRHGYGDLLHLGLIECRAGERTQACWAYGASAALRVCRWEDASAGGR